MTSHGVDVEDPPASMILPAAPSIRDHWRHLIVVAVELDRSVQPTLPHYYLPLVQIAPPHGPKNIVAGLG